jgi:deoxyribodipyrimidine photo-lyase
MGGRREALRLLRRFGKIATKYKTARDNLYIDGTSHLGPHLHFGTVSPREVYHFVGAPEFRKQLYWREFYMYISNYVAPDYSKISWTLPKFNRVKWQTNNTALNRWKSGKTGIPIVDAGMRELVNSGHMHNRARMICAMYLIHYLGIHWREGERWFAQNLMDYSYANNYGGWVWCAGVEVHSNPYFRIYSMEQQNKRFDPDCIYIKKWCPELREQTPKEILAAYVGLDKVRARRIEYLKSI